MIKHLKIFWYFIRTSVIREMEFRANFITNNLINFLWAGYILIIIEVIFNQTNSLAGWSKPEVLFLMGTWMLVDEISRLTFSPNLKNLADHIFKGNLDFVVTKPLNTQFMISLNYFNIKAAPMILVDLGIIIYALSMMSINFSGANIFLYLLLLIAGLIINYSFLLILMIFNFWFDKAGNIFSLWESFTHFGRYPISIFPKTIMLVLVTFVPIAFLSVFPSMAFLGKLSWEWIAYALSFSIFIFWFARKFWNFAIRHYSSASS